MPQEGMLLQLDGSHHLWLEDRGPWLTLLLAVETVPDIFRTVGNVTADMGVTRILDQRRTDAG